MLRQMQQLNVSQLVLLLTTYCKEVMDGGFSSFTTVTEVSSLTIQWRRCCATGVCAKQSCSLPCASSKSTDKTRIRDEEFMGNFEQKFDDFDDFVEHEEEWNEAVAVRRAYCRFCGR